MRKIIIKLTIVALVAVSFVGPMGARNAAAQSKTLVCESFGGNYNYCRADTDNNVVMEKRLSMSSCEYDRDWGYDKRGIWVDHGCRAEFRYGGSNKGAAIAGGAILGGLILAGVLASKSKRSEEDNDGWKDGSSHIESFFVGTFRGWNPRRNEMADVTIHPDGEVTVTNQRGSYYETGDFRDRYLSLPWDDLDVEKDGSGFTARGSNGMTYTFVRVR